jgi:hypothetical protein
LLFDFAFIFVFMNLLVFKIDTAISDTVWDGAPSVIAHYKTCTLVHLFIYDLLLCTQYRSIMVLLIVVLTWKDSDHFIRLLEG